MRLVFRCLQLGDSLATRLSTIHDDGLLDAPFHLLLQLVDPSVQSGQLTFDIVLFNKCLVFNCLQLQLLLNG